MGWLLIKSGRKYPQIEVVLLRSWGYDPACYTLIFIRIGRRTLIKNKTFLGYYA